MRLIQLDTSDVLYEKALDLRYELFFKEPGLPRKILFDALESTSSHLAIVDENKLLAYGRLSEITPKHFKISQMVVAPSMQRKGLGFRVLSTLVELALENEAEEITLSSRLHAVHMYEKLNFQAVGNTYVSESTGVAHVKMVRCC